MPQWLVIGVSGVTCGGKTTLAQNLRDYFQSKQNSQLWQTPYTIGEVRLISQDDYFLPVEDRRHKWIERLNAINFELITALDMKQMLSDIRYFINEITISTTNLEHYNGTIQMAAMMPPPNQMLHYHGNNKLQKQQQQQQQQQSHYQTNNYYHTHTHNHHTHQQQQQQHQQHHNQRSQQQQQTRQHHNQQHQHQQSQRHSVRLVNGIPSNHHHHHHQNASGAAAANATAGIKIRDCKVNILIIEGFMIFNQPELLTLCNIKFHFHLPYEKCYERRRQRTYEPPDVTGYFEMCVWPYYEKNFSEFRDRKDIIFLNGEIGQERIRDFALKKIAKYVEERCDVLMVTTMQTPTPSPTTTSTAITSFTTPPPHKVIGIHNSNNNGSNVAIKPCPMEQH